MCKKHFSRWLTVFSTCLASRLNLAKVLLGVFSSDRKTFSWNLFVILGEILLCQNWFQKTFLSKYSLNFIHLTKNWLQVKCYNLWSTTTCHTETRPTFRREICSILWSHILETNRFVNIDAYFSPIAFWIFDAIKIHFVFTEWFFYHGKSNDSKLIFWFLRRGRNDLLHSTNLSLALDRPRLYLLLPRQKNQKINFAQRTFYDSKLLLYSFPKLLFWYTYIELRSRSK